MSAISRIFGLTGKSLGNGFRFAGLGVSAIATKDLAVSIHKSGAIQSAAGNTGSFLGQVFKPVKDLLSPHVSNIMQSSYVAPVVDTLASAGQSVGGFAYNMFGSLFGRELLNTAIITNPITQYLGQSPLPAFTLLSGHLGALGFALPIALAGGKAVSRFMLKGQVARGLMHAYPELSREVVQDPRRE